MTATLYQGAAFIPIPIGALPTPPPLGGAYVIQWPCGLSFRYTPGEKFPVTMINDDVPSHIDTQFR